MSDIANARAEIEEAAPLIPAHRKHVLVAFRAMLDVAEHDPPAAQAWLERMGPPFVAAGPVATVRAGLAGELKGAALDAADLEVVRLMRPRRQRATR